MLFGVVAKSIGVVAYSLLEITSVHFENCGYMCILFLNFSSNSLFVLQAWADPWIRPPGLSACFVCFVFGARIGNWNRGLECGTFYKTGGVNFFSTVEDFLL